eukprot:jgi/Phyca11/132955/e_gw1.277.4.1
MTSSYARRWGFHSGENTTKLSYWSPAPDRKGGVAILIDPYGAFISTTPLATEFWSPHFMAIAGKVEDTPLVVVNIYAPHRKAASERFFAHLMQLDFPPGARLAVGGDFNCTLDEVADRSYHSVHNDHGSEMLQNLLTHWALSDPVALGRPALWNSQALAKHQMDTHTFHYPVKGTGEGSSRLDRWYVSAPLMEWVAGTEVVIPEVKADHRAACMHLSSPNDPIRVRKPTRIYPVPKYAEEAVASATLKRLEQFHEQLQQNAMTAAQSARAWDDLKVAVAKETLALKRQRRQATNRRLAQTLRRLVKQQQRWQEVERNAQLIVRTCKQRRSAVRRQHLFQSTTHWTGKTTKEMFRRVSNKFQDCTIRRLDPVEGAPTRSVH